MAFQYLWMNVENLRKGEICKFYKWVQMFAYLWQMSWNFLFFAVLALLHKIILIVWQKLYQKILKNM